MTNLFGKINKKFSKNLTHVISQEANKYSSEIDFFKNKIFYFKLPIISLNNLIIYQILNCLSVYPTVIHSRDFFFLLAQLLFLSLHMNKLSIFCL